MISRSPSPAPWTHFTPDPDTHEIHDANGKPVVKWTGFDGLDMGLNRIVANAMLIAAAPILLNACQAALHAIEEFVAVDGSVIWIPPPYQAPAVHESASERLRAAIDTAFVGRAGR